MDAPTYPPATAFEPPVAAPYEFSVQTASLADLMGSPAAWAIVVKHAPGFKMAVNAPQLKPQLSNFTVEDFITFGVVKRAAVDAIDAELRQLPRAEPAAQ
jgi:hypothetical protein